MTQPVNDYHEERSPRIEVTQSGRKVFFNKDCFEDVEIWRKINDEDSKLLIRKVRSPLIDEEPFPEGTRLVYTISFKDRKAKPSKFEVFV